MIGQGLSQWLTLDIPHGDELDDVPRRDPAGRALQPLAVISIQDLQKGGLVDLKSLRFCTLEWK